MPKLGVFSVRRLAMVGQRVKFWGRVSAFSVLLYYMDIVLPLFHILA